MKNGWGGDGEPALDLAPYRSFACEARKFLAWVEGFPARESCSATEARDRLVELFAAACRMKASTADLHSLHRDAERVDSEDWLESDDPDVVSAGLEKLLAETEEALKESLGRPIEGACSDEEKRETEAWSRVYEAVFRSCRILPVGYYRTVLEPLSFEFATDSNGCGDVADDIADTYRDLREAVELLDEGRDGEAFWKFQFGFEVHWGEHVSSAIHALNPVALAESRERGAIENVDGADEEGDANIDDD